MNALGRKTVVDRDGLRGTVEARSREGTRRRALVRLEDGREAWLDEELLEPRGDDAFYLPVSLAETAGLSVGEDGEIVIPLAQEELRVGKRTEVGGVRVVKRVHERQEVVDLPGYVEEVEVERVPVNQVVEGPVSMREEGSTIIVPVLEEVIVVEKRLMVREELRITRRRRDTTSQQTVTLRTEDATVEDIRED
jgi:uncharacterized protein (TIGR02271 family)